MTKNLVLLYQPQQNTMQDFFLKKLWLFKGLQNLNG